MPSQSPLKKPQAKSNAVFSSLYSKLNPEQKKVVDAVEGPVMVFAGPGTGKTQVLAMRAANILRKTDVGPHNILALTFTESAAKAMRDRLISIIGEDAYYVNIATFHSFCSDVIQSNPEFFPFSRDAEPLTDLERFTIVENIIREQPFEAIKPINSPTFYVRDCIKAMQDLKRENVEPDDFRKLIEYDALQLKKAEKLSKTEQKQREKNIAKQHELLQVYILYQQKLREMGRYDYEDMISFAVHAFEQDEILLRSYQERLQYILVDEYQDTNAAQNAVLELLASYWGKQANVFVVGDSDQSLYRFQGASLENSVAFVKKYPSALFITLTKNYRSTQTILDAAADLIAKNSFTHATLLKKFQKTGAKKSTRTSVPLSATVSYPAQPVYVAAFSSDLAETAYIAEEISTLIKKGTNPSEVAVLYRTNNDSAAIEDALVKWEIPYEIDSGVDVLDSPVVMQLLTLFHVIYDLRTTREAIDLFTVLNYEWIGLDALDLLKLSRRAAEKKQSLFDIVQGNEIKALQLKKAKEIVAFVQKLVQWSKDDAQKTFPLWFETVLNDSGFLSWVLKRNDAAEAINKIQSLFREVKIQTSVDKSTKLETFLRTIERMQDHRIAVNEEVLQLQRKAVKLATAHSAKGREWEYVFIIRAIDGKWGNTRSKDLIPLPEGILRYTNIEEKEKNEDDRRVFYVALTRAKKRVTVTYAKTSVSGNRTKENTQTLFVEEIPEKLKKEVNTSSFEQSANAVLAKLLHAPVNQTQTIEENEWLSGLLENFVLTPTTLNTYLECAYKFKLNTLVKVPRAKEDYLAFGTAIHKALEMLFRSFIEKNKIPSKEFVIDEFEKSLHREIMTQDEEKARLNQGRKVLSAYYDEYTSQFAKPVFLEKFLGYGWPRIYLDDIRIGGRIDKIEWADDAHKTVTVVDYKTGQPKTRGEIEGKTKTSNGDYKRQLLFYKLLTDLDRSFGHKVEKGMFDFIEKDKQTGKFRREEFLLPKEEVDGLRNIIKDVMAEVRALHFPRTTHYSVCKDCEFSQHCWPDGIPEQKAEQMKLVTL